MTARYIRVRPRRQDEVAAALVSGAVAAGVGLVTFYVVRLLLSREHLGGVPERRAATHPEEE